MFRVSVEVTDSVETRGKYTFQECFIDLGDKYPVKVSRFVRDGEQPLKPGSYVAEQGQIVDRRPVVDLQHLAPQQSK